MWPDIHLLIETPEPNLGSGMRWDKRGAGLVFQGPYGSTRVRDDVYFMRVAAYVLANAAAAGLCERGNKSALTPVCYAGRFLSSSRSGQSLVFATWSFVSQARRAVATA